MIAMHGQRTFSRPLDEVLAKLSDARFLILHVPDVDESKPKEVDQASANCTIRPGFSFIRGTLRVELRILESSESSDVRFSLSSKGIGSSSEAEAHLRLMAENEATTKVDWTVEVTKLGGLLKAVPKGLIRGAAEKVINDVWAKMETSLNEEQTES